MQTYYLLRLALTFHIIGLTVAGGISLANHLSYRRFWREYSINKIQVLSVLTVVSKYPRLIAIGITISIISGAAMMYIAYSGFMAQQWFHIKLGLIIAMILNTFILSRWPARLRKIMSMPAQEMDPQKNILVFRKKIRASTSIQLVLFLLIFVLAVFRFN